MRLTPEVKALIRKLKDDSPESIALQSKRYPDLPMALIAQQVKARQRARTKLPSWCGNESIVFSRSLSLEQSSSEYTADYKAKILRGETLADLTGGFGVDAFAFSGKFNRVFHIERDRELSEVVAENAIALGKEKVLSTVVADGLDWLDKYPDALDVIYLDPARRDRRSLRVSALEDCEPNILPHWETLLTKAKRVALKLSPGLDIDRVLTQLSCIQEVHVVSIENDCKECFCVAKEGHEEEARIVCVNRRLDSVWDKFVFYRSEEKQVQGEYSRYSNFLYEPNASIMKAGGFKSLGRECGLKLLHPRTRFYTSKQFQNDFPGRVFEVLDAGDLKARSAAALFPEGKANVLARNAGLSSEALKRKLKLSNGGELFAIGTTDIEGTRRLLKCRKMKRVS